MKRHHVGDRFAIVAKLNAEINKVLATPELRNAILTLSAQPKGGTSEAFDG